MDTISHEEPRQRERNDALVLGVAARLGSSFSCDPLWFRIAFVLFGLVAGAGVVLYAVLWLAVVAPSVWAQRAGLLALVIGPPWLLVAAGVDPIDGPLAVVALLIGLAAALWMRPVRSAEDQTVFAPPVVRAVAPVDVVSAGTAPVDVVPEIDQQPTGRRRLRPRRSPREASPLGRTTLGMSLVLGAVWALADTVDGGRLHPEQWFGAAALVCGAGLVIGTVWGRSRWLVVPALFLALMGAGGGAMARLGIPLTDAYGTADVLVQSASNPGTVRASVAVGEAWATIEPRRGGEPVTVEARMVVGTMWVNVASSDIVEIRAEMGSGDLRVDDFNSGMAVDVTSDVVEDGVRIVRLGRVGTPDVVIDARLEHADLIVGVVGYSPENQVVEPTVTPAPDIVVNGLPLESADLVAINGRHAVYGTADGWIVLGYSPGDDTGSRNSVAVIGPDNEVVSGRVDVRPNGETRITTAAGVYRLLPRGLLLTPRRTVVDLVAARAALAGSDTPDSPVTTDPATDPATDPTSSPATESVTTTLAPSTLPPTTEG